MSVAKLPLVAEVVLGKEEMLNDEEVEGIEAVEDPAVIDPEDEEGSVPDTIYEYEADDRAVEAALGM